MRRNALLLIAVVLLAAQSIDAQVSNARLLNATREPQNWLTYSGRYDSQRYSLLNRITPANAKDLELKWVYQTFSTWAFEPTPLVVDGVMYLTSGPNDVIALDAVTGRPFWIQVHAIGRFQGVLRRRQSRGRDPRRHAVHGHRRRASDRLDAVTGRVRWNTPSRTRPTGYAISHRATGDQGQSHGRNGRRRVPDARLHRGLRCPHRKGSLEVLHDSRQGRAGQQHLALMHGSTAAARSGTTARTIPRST